MKDEKKERTVYNGFIYRMKKIAEKKASYKFIDLQASKHQQYFFSRIVPDEENWHSPTKTSPLNTTQNLRSTLSPKYQKQIDKNKKQSKFGIMMPQIAKVQKKTTEKMIFQTTRERPLWRSLQFASQKKHLNTTSKYSIFRKTEDRNPEIEFCTTNNIFIFKKIKGEKQPSLVPVVDKKSDNSAPIKYKKKENLEIKTSDSPIKQRTEVRQQIKKGRSLSKNNNIAFHRQKMDPILNIRNLAEVEKGEKEENKYFKYFEGVYTLEPWNFHTQEDKHHFYRTSPRLYDRGDNKIFD